jgi:hypothetical protein
MILLAGSLKNYVNSSIQYRVAKVQQAQGESAANVY